MKSDFAAHEFHELPGDGEAETRAAEAARRRAVGLHERLEKLPLRRERDANARVGHLDAQHHPAAVLAHAPRRDADLALGRELDGVAHEVEQHLPDAAGIAPQRDTEPRVDVVE